MTRAAGWFAALGRHDRQFVREYLGRRERGAKDIHWDLIRLALSSTARLAVIPMQDYLGLGSEARINVPSTLGQNWRWRLLPGEVTEELLEKCRRMAQVYGRT